MITIQFSTENTALSELIRLFDHGWCSHVDAVLPDGRLLGARMDGGVLIRPPNYVNFSRVLKVEIPVTATEIFYGFLTSQVGKAYDTKAIAAFAFDRDWRSQDSWFCSELIAAALEKCWFTHKLATVTNRITPSDLLLTLSATVDIPV